MNLFNIKKSKNAVSKVYNPKGKLVGYLTEKQEENGNDIQLDILGYKIVTI